MKMPGWIIDYSDDEMINMVNLYAGKEQDHDRPSYEITPKSITC